jgi:hypothetical protein
MISRFITKQLWLDEDKRVTPEAFFPLDNHGQLETSIVDTEALSEIEVWQKGEQLFKSFFGRADVERETIESLSLRIHIDNDPIEKHGNILGWSSEKSEQLLCAEKLAKTSKVEDRRYKRS